MNETRFGIVGLGRMGGGIVANLLRCRLGAVVYDVNLEAVRRLEGGAVQGAQTLAELASHLAPPRVIWIMVPAGDPVDQVIQELVPHLAAGDVLIDGGNSNWRDSIRRAAALKEKGIYYLDCGTSGGLEGAQKGLCLMVGGEQEAYKLAEPFLRAVAQEGGCAYVGESGAGHFVKMVHNGIEYGMLEAIGEGFELLAEGPYELDLAQIAELWTHGSVVRSWLMELAARALKADPGLDRIAGVVGGGSTGSWTIEEGWRFGVPMPVISAAFNARLRSRQNESFSGKLVAALRHEFGGHPVVPKG